MTSSPELASWLPLLARLVDEPDAPRREHAILAAARRLTGATAAALWRPGPRGWQRALAVGACEDLPADSIVAALAAGRLDVQPPAGCAVVVAAHGRLPCALALGGLPPENGSPGVSREEHLEWIEASLVGHGLLAVEESPDLVDLVLPPFQGERDDRNREGVHGVEPVPEAQELRTLMGEIRRVQERIGRGCGDLPDGDRAVEVLEHQCQRAGDLWIQAALGSPGAAGSPPTPWTPALGELVAALLEGAAGRPPTVVDEVRDGRPGVLLEVPGSLPPEDRAFVLARRAGFALEAGRNGDRPTTTLWVPLDGPV